MNQALLKWFVVLTCLCGAGTVGANDELAQADELRLTGRYEEAAEAYKKLTAQEPPAAVGLSRCYHEIGKSAEAENTLVESLAKHNEAAVLHAELAWLTFDRGDYPTAQQHVDAALKLDDSDLAARWILAELHRVHGRLEQAQTGYLWFVRYYNREQRNIDDADDIRWIGLAALQYARWVRNSGQFSFVVNVLYPKALNLEENYWRAHLESGLLFLEKYNEPDAAAEFDAALAINPNAAEVHAARAQLALENFELDKARTSIERALKINPNLREAYQLQADLLMANFRFEEAEKVLENALKLNARDEKTLGRLAAVYGASDGLEDDLAGTRLGTAIDRAVENNEHCGRFFYSLAEAFDLLRRYPQAAKYYDIAQQRMPQLLGPRGKLGLMYMRLGDEANAAKLLKESFDIDPFNVRVKNMLAVLDLLAGYATIETEHFVIKFDRGSDELLAKYAAQYLEEEVFPAIVERMGYEPQGKSLFEFFSRSGRTSGHGWFSARMVGLPYIGTVGACAGRVVALASPNDMDQKYNWACVLEHEFVHVVNLQQTDFNIPHWFTEALAVWNEGYPRPAAWTELLAQRAAENTLFNLNTINLGFIKPKSSGDWTLAYCQSELYAEYMLERFGEDALSKMLTAYADNLRTEAAIQRCFGVSQEEFEAGYREHLANIVQGVALGGVPVWRGLAELQRAVQDDPQNAGLLAELAYAYLQRGQLPDARQHALAALQQQEKQQLAAYVLARVYLSIGDTSQAIGRLEESFDAQSPQENHLGLLAGLKMKAEEYGKAEQLYQLGAEKFPHADKWTKALAILYLHSGDDEKLNAQLEGLAALDADDFTVREKLAQLAAGRRDHDAAAKWAMEAIHIDVMDAETHAMLAQARAGQEDYAAAIDEFETAIQLDGEQLPWRFALADACIQADEKDKAQKVLDNLLKLDSNFPGADLLLESLDEE